MFRYIVKYVNIEKSKRPYILKRGSIILELSHYRYQKKLQVVVVPWYPSIPYAAAASWQLPSSPMS